MKVTNNIGKVKLIFVFFFISVILNVVFFIVIKNHKNSYKYELIGMQRKSRTLETLNRNYRDMILNNIGSESSPINPDMILTNVITNTKTKIGEITENSPILILRFTEYSCHVCVEQSLSKIQSMSHPFKQGKFIILASYENLRALLLFKHDNNISYPIYTIQNDTLHVPLEKLNFPYFFILDKEYKAKNIFYPLTSSPELTDDYFSVIQFRYPMLFR